MPTNVVGLYVVIFGILANSISTLHCWRNRLGAAYQLSHDSMQVVVAVKVFLCIAWLLPRKNTLKARTAGGIYFTARSDKS